MRRTLLVPFAFALASVAAACGDDSGGSQGATTVASTTTALPTVETTVTTVAPTTSPEATSPAATTAEPAPTTAAPSDADDQAIADSLVLTQDDLGPEWTATPADSDDTDEPNPLDECAGGTGVLDVEPSAEADSPDFALGPNYVSSSASVYSDAQTIADQLAVYTDPAIPGCIATLFEEQLAPTLPEGVTIEGFEFESLDFPPVQGTGYAFGGGGTIVEGSTRQPFAIVVIGDSTGRAGVSVQFQFLGEADQALVTSVWDAMEDKLAAVDG